MLAGYDLIKVPMLMVMAMVAMGMVAMGIGLMVEMEMMEMVVATEEGGVMVVKGLMEVRVWVEVLGGERCDQSNGHGYGGCWLCGV